MIEGRIASLIGYRDSERVILEMFYQRVYQVAYFMLNDRNNAQDIVLNTFQKAFKYLHKVQNGERLEEWLTTIAIRSCQEHLQKNQKYITVDDLFHQDPSINDDYLSTIENVMDEKYLMSSLQQKLQPLHPDYKQVVLMKYHYNMKEDEMAHSFDLNISTVKARLHLAKLTLLMETLEQPAIRDRKVLPHEKKVNLDRMIREAILENMKNCPYPPLSSTEVWEQLKKPLRLVSIPGLQLFSNKRIGVIAAPLLLILAIAVAWLSSSQGESLQTTTASPDELPVDSYDVIVSIDKKVEVMEPKEAMEVTQFPILVPQHLPEEFNLSQAKVIRNPDEKSKEVHFIYRGEKRAFVLSELAIGEEYGLGSIVNRSQTDVEEIRFNGQKAKLFLYNNGVTQLIWVNGKNYFSIEGHLTRDEIISIASSM